MYIDVNSTNLFYECAGSGEALVLVHGNGETHNIFASALPILCTRYTVYTPDSRGHGFSAKAAVLHYEDMAEDMYCFIKKLKLEKPVFAGFSDGGIIGLILAAKHPDCISKLIVCGANTSPKTMKPLIRTILSILYFFNCDPKFKLMISEPHITAEMLNKIKVPVYVTAGERDMIKRSDTEFIARNVPLKDMSIFKGETHSSYILKGDILANYILSI